MIQLTRALVTASSRRTGRRTITTKSPGSNPLEILRQECTGRQLCNEQGFRLKESHWVCAFAMPMENGGAPNLRTINIQRVSPAGIDMIFKAGGATAQRLEAKTPVSLLHTQGRFVQGESSEQYRGEGTCVSIPLADVHTTLPLFTLTGMLATRRREAEVDTTEESRTSTGIKAHWTQIVQQTRYDLENDRISMEEIEQCVEAFRFRPERIEFMVGSSDSITWERWEWISDITETLASAEDPIVWNPPRHIVPH